MKAYASAFVNEIVMKKIRLEIGGVVLLFLQIRLTPLGFLYKWL